MPVALCPRRRRSLPSQPFPEEPLQPAPPVLSPKHCAPGPQPEPQGRANGGWWQNGVPLVSTWAPCLLLTAPALQTPRRHQLLFWALLCPQLRAPRCGRRAPFFILKAFCFKGVLEGLTLTSWDPGVFVLHSLGTGSGQFGGVGSGGGGGRGRVVVEDPLLLQGNPPLPVASEGCVGALGA